MQRARGFQHLLSLALVAGLLLLIGFPWLAAVVLAAAVSLWMASQFVQRRRVAEQRNRRNEQRLKAIFETAVDPIITITGQGRIESFNPAAERLFGYSADEIKDQNIKILMPTPYREEHDHYLRRYHETGQSSIIGCTREVTAMRKDGGTFPIALSVSQAIGHENTSSTRHLQGDAERDLLFTGIIRDLTEQKKLEAELVRAREAADAANHAKTEFLANMSHEIRTPMTAILGFAELVLGNVSDPSNIDGLKTIQRNGEYLLEIINDILDLSKIEAGKLSLERIECSPLQILQDIASLMHVRTQAKGLALEMEFVGPVPKTIRSDPTRLRQILLNLTSNAVKFTEIGTIRLVATCPIPSPRIPKSAST